MSLRRLRYFVTVADELSFTAAARALHMAQPPLSTQIRELERELRVELFRRTHRGVTLTAAGHALLPEVRQLVERYDSLGAMGRNVGSGDVGRLAIGLIPSAANGRLPAVLARFAARLPGIEVTLTEDRPPELLRRLRAELIDVALLYAQPREGSYNTAVLDTERLLLAAPDGHPLARRRRVPVAALTGQPLILPPRHGGEGLYERITGLLARHHITPVVVQSDVWMMQTIVGLVSAGIGLAVVPESATVLRAGEVRYLPLIGAGELIPLVAAWRRDTDQPTVERLRKEWAALVR